MLTLSEGLSGDISLKSHVPFRCGKMTKFGCFINIETLSNYLNSVLKQTSCGSTRIAHETWNQSVSLVVHAAVTSLYGSNTLTAKLLLKTPTELPSQPFWANYTIGTATIVIEKDTSLLELKLCEIISDPYVYTFDGSFFTLNSLGRYTMYKLGKDIEIQVEITECGGLTGTCVCGVAVRVGQTVFEITGCNIPVWSIGYTACGDGGDVMRVRRRASEYKIYLPTGGHLKVRMFSEMNNEVSNENIMNVVLTPSPRDPGKSRGLCGNLSSTCEDDYILRDNSNSTPSEASLDFAESWRVPPNEDLFNLDVVRNGLSSYKTLQTYCVCDKKQQKIRCSPMEGAHFQLPSNHFKDVRCVISKRKRRMAPIIHSRLRRQTPTQDFDEQAAIDHCNEVFRRSTTVSVCINVPGVNINKSRDDCVRDIKLYGSTRLELMSVDTVRASCLKEVTLNPVLQQPDPETPSSQTVFQEVTAVSCPSDCTGRGVCTGGRCQCNDGSGGEDCSANMTRPPRLLEAENGGQCDPSESSCSRIAVYGGTFLGLQGSRCKIQIFQLNQDGTVVHTSTATSEAEDQSISEVLCTVSTQGGQLSTSPSAVMLYNISVANTDEIYSAAVPLFVYDATCIAMDTDTQQWALKDGYCLHGNRCVPVGRPRPDDPCAVCSITDTIKSWQPSTDRVCVESNSATLPQPWIFIIFTFSLSCGVLL